MRWDVGIGKVILLRLKGSFHVNLKELFNYK